MLAHPQVYCRSSLFVLMFSTKLRVQASAAEAGGMKMILNLWELALVDQELLPDLLGLLRNMVADSASAQRSFCSQVHS